MWDCKNVFNKETILEKRNDVFESAFHLLFVTNVFGAFA
jgi:hypothetical protein